MGKLSMLSPLLLVLFLHIGLASVWADQGEGKTKDVPVLGVEGVVMCQHCKHINSHSLEQAWPTSGAQVQLSCPGSGSTPGVNKVVVTNYDGFFLISIEGFDFESIDIKGCRVTLISSPEKYCNTLTDINRGTSGARIFFREYNENQAIYAAGPFAFAPSHEICDTMT